MRTFSFGETTKLDLRNESVFCIKEASYFTSLQNTFNIYIYSGQQLGNVHFKDILGALNVSITLLVPI